MVEWDEDEGLAERQDDAIVVDEGVAMTEAFSLGLADLWSAEHELNLPEAPRLVEFMYAKLTLPIVTALRLLASGAVAGIEGAARLYVLSRQATLLDRMLGIIHNIDAEDPLGSVVALAIKAGRRVSFSKEGSEFDRLFTEADLQRIELLLKIHRFIRAVVRDPAEIQVRGSELWIRGLTRMAEVLASYPRVIVLDATAEPEHYRKIRPDVEVIEPQVACVAPPNRMILYRGRIGRKALLPGGRPDWELVSRLLEYVLEGARKDGVRSLLFVSHKALAKELREANSPVAVLLRRWDREGRSIDIRWFGNLRGQNLWADFDGCATIGDPFTNLRSHQDEARFLKLSDEERERTYVSAAAGELQQVHGRLRDVRRDDAPWHLHIGRVAPGDWTSGTTEVVTMPRGRPPREGPVPPGLVSAAIEALGGLRAAARALGVSHTALRRYRDGTRKFPPEFAKRIRLVARRKGLENFGSTSTVPAPGTENVYQGS